jgi:hypothetical protein
MNKGGNPMKKLIFKVLFLTLVVFAPVSAMAEVSVHVDIPLPLPPPIIFPAPPEVVPVPETDVYVVPDVQEDIFFSGGWWWRPWEGRWYRSRYYDRGWTHYRHAPSFYANMYPGWRNDYRNHRWRGHQWDYQRVPHRDLNRNWQGWQKDRHWEKQNNWGVRGLPPRQHPQGMVKHEPQQYRDARQQREVRPQPRPQQSRDIKAQRRPAGEAKGQNKHEGEPREGQERR